MSAHALHHTIVLIWPSAVISMEKHYFLTKPMCFEEVQMMLAPLPHSPRLSAKKLTLRGRGFTVHSEHSVGVRKLWLECIR